MKMRLALASFCFAAAAFAPATGASVLLHVSADELALADGAPVAAWGPLAQTVVGSQPTFRSTAMNGRPAVDIDVTNDYLTDGPVTGARSVIVVTRFVDGGSLATLVSNDNDRLNVRRNGTTNAYRSVGRSGDDNDFYRHANHAGQDNVYVNGVGAGTFTVGASHVVISNAGAPGNYTSFTLGRASSSLGRYWGGDVSEVYVLDRTLTADEITGISSILAERWGSAPVAATPAQIAAGRAALPEPSGVGLLALGALGVLRRRRR